MILPLPARQGQSVALVTGAAGIIGPSICRVLRAAGWFVVASDRSEEPFQLYDSVHEHPFDADAIVHGDLGSEDGCRRLIAETEATAGPLSLIVNSATAHDRYCSFADTDSAFCHLLLNVDLLAPLFLAQSARASLAANRGCIVNLSSVHTTIPLPGSPFYRVVKAAVEKLTETLAMEFGPQGIRVNAVRVGRVCGDAFLRPALRQLAPDLAKELYQEIMPPYLAEMARQGAGTATHIAHLVAYLASPQSAFVQGTVIPADGGLPLQKSLPLAPDSTFSEWSKDPESALQHWRERRKSDASH